MFISTADLFHFDMFWECCDPQGQIVDVILGGYGHRHRSSTCDMREVLTAFVCGALQFTKSYRSLAIGLPCRGFMGHDQ